MPTDTPTPTSSPVLRRMGWGDARTMRRASALSRFGGAVAHDDAELVAAQAGQHVAGAHLGQQALADFF